MTPENAARLLQAHSGRDAETDPAKWEHGFVAVHRSAPDDDHDATFRELMACVRALAPRIAASPTVDRELMAALWGLIYLPRMWAFNPRQLAGLAEDGHRLDPDQLSRLADQLDRIAEAVDGALNGVPESVADATVGYGDPLPNYAEAVNRHAGPSAAGDRDPERE